MSSSANFKIVSPGKVILHGEHAVVYHKPALAAVVGLATTLEFRVAPDAGLVASFQLETLNCTLEIQVAHFNAFLASFRAKYPDADVLESTAQLLEAVRAEVAKQLDGGINVGGGSGASGGVVTLSPQQQHMQKAFLAIYFLLAGAILSAPPSSEDKLLATLSGGFRVHIASDLSIGAGLGSSASFGAALAAAFLLHAGHFDFETYLAPDSQALISQWAFESERIMHGTPSGVDNTVCTYGGMLRFVKGQGFQSLRIQRPLNILLVDSRVQRSTADVVANVRHLAATFPRILAEIWNACEALVADAIPLYEQFGSGQDDSAKFEQLERLFQINNDLLKAVGVTHPKLEQIFAIACKRGFFGKLTGAGAGGFAVILLPENYQGNEVYGKLRAELEAAGFGVYATTAGGEGLRIKPLLPNGDGVEEKE